MRSIRLFAASLILACLAAPVPAAAPGGARNDAWEVIGPGGGGAMFHPAISPHDPNVVLVGCDMTGAYLTKDGGKSWRMINLRGSPRFFAFAPSDANTLYIKSTGLWRSADAGATWALIHPRPKAVRELTLSDDEADEGVETAWDEGSIGALAVDPQDSRVLYAVLWMQGQPSLQRSTDEGRGWKTLTTAIPEGARGIYIDPDSPANARTVYVVGTKSAAVIEGKTVRLGAIAPEPFVDSSAGFPGKGAKAVIYGASTKALFVSRDGSATWVRKTPGGGLRAVATSLFHPEVAYVSFGGKPQPLPDSFGVAKTEDFGATWRDVWSETEGNKSPTVDDGWLSERLGPDWGENPLELSVSAEKPEICYETDLGRTLRTLDGGATWTAAYTRRVPGAIGTDGDGALYRSANAGQRWEKVPLPAGVNGPNGLAIDPEDPNRLYLAAWRRNTSDPKPGGGIYLSTDGGAKWKPVLTRDQYVYDVTIDPRDKSLLYAAGFQSSAWRSTDRGASWQRIRGYNFKFGHRVIPDPLDASKIYITTFGGSVWHGPAAGDPRAAEDIVTPIAAYSK